MTTLRTRLAQVAVLVTAPALASCSTSFGATTDQDYIPARGVNDRSGPVDVLNVLVVSETDGSGTVVASLVNNTREDESLNGVTVGGTEATVAQDARDIPVDGINNLGATGAVTATSSEIEEGSFVEVTFSFQNADAITVEAPVVPHEGDYEDVPLEQVR